MMKMEITIGDYLSMCAWWEQLPAVIQELVARFPPGSKWRLRNQGQLNAVANVVLKPEDWFEPHSFTDTHMVDMVLFDAATGRQLIGTYRLRPQDLIPAGS